ncbi:MAG TPA: UvrB/UvrC motif-containing protein, partial [Spirochaetia bacterium]|nr:UvrB/UvrC motif-containing protein [Spirochaetia bacterium]
MSKDISSILEDWEYDPEKSIRVITADDGREVLQVRLPLGVEQYELDGRPDGVKPYGKGTLLEEFQERARLSDTEFKLSHDDFVGLSNEGILFYYRYLRLFQLGDYRRTARDTDHNMQLCELVEKHGEEVEDKNTLLQYKPYIMRMNAISKAMMYLHKHLKSAAREILEAAIENIRNLPEVDTPSFQFERVRSIDYLESALKQVHEKEFDPLDNLREELKQAIEEENYERAAELRD